MAMFQEIRCLGVAEKFEKHVSLPLCKQITHKLY